MTQAIVKFKDGSKSIVRVNQSYARGMVHYYNLTLNSLNTFLDFAPGVSKLYTGEEISELTYIMS